MTPHYRRHCAQRDFEANASKLRIELSLKHARRRHLDTLVDLLECNLRDAGDSILTRGYGRELAELRRLVRERSLRKPNERAAMRPSHLRVVK